MRADEAYILSKGYTDESLEGGGAIKGKNCTIESIEPISGGQRVTFKWTLDDGTEQTGVMDVPNGAKGDKGDKGDTGPRGLQGVQGATGAQGAQGIQGPKGDTGATGAQGIQGIQGVKGDKGDDGYPFLIYKQYDNISEFSASDFPEIGLMFMVMTWETDPVSGDDLGYPIYRYTGEGTPPYSLVVHMNTQGIKGDKGDKGDTGAQGIQGEKGDKGDKGDTGDQGIQGIQGETGAGVAEGGTTGQVLVKVSSTDYDTTWKDTTDTVRPNSHALVESGSVYSAINNALSSIYTPRGELACADLTATLLVEENVGNVYEMSDSGQTTALFLQGAGEAISAGDNVGIIKAGANTYLFNLMANAFDLTDYQKKELSSGAEIEDVIPSDASASNKLVTSNDTSSTTLTSTDTLASWVGNAKGVMTAFIVASSKPSDIGSPLSSWGETMIWCIGDGIRKTLFAIDFSVTQHVIYTREYYNGSFITNWTAIKDGNLTSLVTSGSTAPITSGALYPVAITTPTPVSGVTGGDDLIYGFKSGKMVTIVLNGIIMANNITQNQSIFTNVPTAVGNKNIYFTVLDYENGKLAVMSIIGDSLAAAFQSDDKSAVHAGRYWGTVTYMTSD